MFGLSSHRTRALSCGLVALFAFNRCLAPVEASPAEEAERKILVLNKQAFAHWHKGEYASARSVFEEAIRIKPEPGDLVSSKARRWVQTNLAWLLATCPDGSVRNGPRAVALAEPVVASTPKDVAYRDTLAAAYAEAGRFEEAVSTQQQALLPLKKGDSLRNEYRDHLKSYEAGKPWRDAGLQQGATAETSEPAGVPAGSTPAVDDFFSSVCVEANTAKARADGHQERAEVMAGLICQIGTKDWGSHGCRENPDQDSCKRTLGVLDADLKASGSSMLFAAAHAGRTDICSIMIAAGSDPNAAISTSWTPLMIAAAENKPETAKLLLAKGANPNAKNSLGRTPAMFAALNGCTEIVEMLAAGGADLNAKPTDKEGMAALIAAASKGHAGTVAALLRLGAHPDAVDATGCTALMHASLDGNVEVIRALLDGGADINVGPPVGIPLAMASALGHVDAVKLLLSRGADVNRTYRTRAGLDGVTPLMIAASEGNEEIVRLLLAAGADLNARNSAGATALNQATTAGNANVVEILGKAARP